jgi:hypothetical protein
MSCRIYLLVPIIAAFSLGCANKAVQTREQATHAALSRYPGNPQRSNDIQIAAIDDPGEKRLEILNLTDRTITDATLWINQRFVHKIKSLKGRDQMSMKYNELIEQGGGVRDLDMANVPVKTVEIQTPDGLYTVQGPSRKQ